MISLTRPLVWIDLESTSKIPAEARIVEIAVHRQNPDGTYQEYWSLVQPGIPIPAEATAIHGITDADVVGKPRWESIAAKVMRAFHDADIGGYHVQYDFDVLRYECARVGVSTELQAGVAPPRLLDGLRLWQILEPRDLSHFVERFLHRKLDAHRADADITGTREGVLALLAEAGDRLPSDLDALHALQFPTEPGFVDPRGKFVWRDGEVVCTFGRHAGKRLRDIPRKDLEWVATKAERMSWEVRVICQNAAKGIYPKRAA